ncbi:MAG: hypothetical protein IJ064_07440 [Bacteroidaceae bacterium]|nr:hypothetical protein [Bacteroidaceae bacterium]
MTKTHAEQPTTPPATDTAAIPLEELVEAYYSCRRRKRSTANALRFELNWEEQIVSLWEDINNRTYRPGRSIAFIVEKPTKREIFAADFRDRVVHHLIAAKLVPLLEKQFIPNSYSTRPGRGTHYGLRSVQEMIRECSHNYTRDCYVMKLDIQGFFMAIEKERLMHLAEHFILRRYKGKDRQLLIWLLKQTLMNRPEEGCIFRSPLEKWVGLPQSKTLMGKDGRRGLPIGNLTSQLMALLFLDELDHRVGREWHIRYYGRYVDDMVLVHPDPAWLLAVRRRIDHWLTAHGQRLHPRKFYLQHYAKGVLFVGGMLLPGRILLSRRTAGFFIEALHPMNAMAERLPLPTPRESDDLLASVLSPAVYHLLASINSYLGLLSQFRAWRFFHRMIPRLSPAWYHHVYITSSRGRMKAVAHGPKVNGNSHNRRTQAKAIR